MKLTKAELKQAEAVRDKLAQPDLSFDDIDWIYQHYHEGMDGDVSRDAAYFTPYGLAFDHALFAHKWGSCVDIAAGNGMLSYAMICRDLHHGNLDSITCIELNPVYHELSKRLLYPMSAYTRGSKPIKINCVLGNIYDRSIWTGLTLALPTGKFDVAISNPPFSNMSKEDKALAEPWMNYTGKRDVAAIELAYRFAKEANFILPPQSVEFRYSGRAWGFERSESREITRLRKKNPDMFLMMECDGIDGTVYRDDWRSTSITVECASLCFDSSMYDSGLRSTPDFGISSGT